MFGLNLCYHRILQGNSGMSYIKVMIADDHAVVREGTRRILEQEPGLVVIADATNGLEAIEMASRLKPDVAIIDISMPLLDGVETTKQIKNNCPEITVLILSAYDDDEFVFNLLEAGAAGYLLKDVRGRELVEAVKAVYAGESVLHPSIARKVLDRFVSTSQKPKKQGSLETLSQREREILKLATRGLSNRDIAEELCLSIRTVQGHLTHIFNKLQVVSRTEAVVRGLKEGWITLDDIP